MSERRSGPVLIDLEAESKQTDATPDPARVPAVPDAIQGPPPQGAVMQQVAALGARRGSRLVKLFWGALAGLIGLLVSTALWNFVTNLIATNVVLGGAAAALAAVLGLALVLLVLREMAAWFRLGRLDRLHQAGEAAVASGDLNEARAVVDQLVAFYGGRPDLSWGLERLAERRGDMFDAEALLGLAEHTLLAPLDRAARAEVEAAARQVATVTAVVPLAFADVATAFASNLRMIRRIAEIYGGRAGTFGSWRLTRTVLTHLVATGAVAVGDDLIGSVAGGGLVGKISRRFGEGVVNGALTARVGVAALEVCRPLPFAAEEKPSVSGLVKRALTGLFGG